MKTPLLVTLFFFSLSIPGKLFHSTTNSCAEWESFVNSDGTNSNLYMRFCNLSESGEGFFEIKNDTDLDAKLLYQINFKNGKNTSNEVIISRDDKVRIHFGDESNNYLSGISSWKFEKIQFRPYRGFNSTK